MDKFNRNNVEKKFNEFLLKSFSSTIFVKDKSLTNEIPLELVDKPLRVVQEIIMPYFDNSLNINIKSQIFGNVFYVGILDAVRESNLVNIVYSIEKLDEEKFIIKDVKVVIEPYMIDNKEEVLSKQTEYFDKLLSESIDNPNPLVDFIDN
ncbi:hypothetical protein BFS06_12325 [Clostridium perfringens]|uniref:Uncharacterized protein n=1 Tax=Clostridium perfringens TaxID=1502 RepID=A0A140GR32_CLOPF|nr:hypothetical protein [Clostridium perfringens]AMN30991.1 hypothetical protein JFP838_pA0075 [Clostridium perfringens]TBX14987.1 hypothetical protein BFS06_12325 [Clostridium perfringens]